MQTDIAFKRVVMAGAHVISVFAITAVGVAIQPTTVRGQTRTAVARAASTQAPAPQPSATRRTGGELVGSLGPDAERALRAGAAAAMPGRPVTSGSLSGGKLLPGRWMNGYFVPYLVADAPVYSRGGSTLLIEPVSPAGVSQPEWFPSTQPPQWRIVVEEHPVQAWRVIDVEDVLCRQSGGCAIVTTRMLARWAPMLRAYAFTDRLGRVWQVE